jgi:hypothetical protein
MKPNRLAFATIATALLGAPALAAAQVPPDDQPAEEQPHPPPFDRPPPPPPPAPAHGAALTYDGGFTLASADGDFELTMGLRTQLRFEAVRADAGDDAEFAARFSLPRVRLQLEGHAYGEATTYKLELEAANKGLALLKDLFVDHAFAGGVHVRVGQWKKPFNRAELVSDFGSVFHERSPQNELAGAGRDQGVALHNDYERSPAGVEWAVGVFNGGSDKPSISCTAPADPADPPTCGLPTNLPADFGPLLVAHLGWNSPNMKGYSEGDLEGGPLRYALAASYKVNLSDLDEDADGNLLLQHAVALDAMLKVHGFDLSGALALVKHGQADAELGFYGQAGAVLMPRRLLGAVRFAQVPEGDDDKQEILGAIDWLWKGHKAKWMLDAGVIRHTGPDTTDLQIRSQLQLVL